MAKTNRFLIAVLLLAGIILPCNVYSQEITGQKFKVFIYSNTFEDSSIEISFKEGNTMLIDGYDGYGLYMTSGSFFGGFFSAPNHSEKNDLLLILSGAAIGGTIDGMGLIFIDYSFKEFFLFSGYEL